MSLVSAPDMVVVKRFFGGLLSSFLRDEMHDRLVLTAIATAKNGAIFAPSLSTLSNHQLNETISSIEPEEDL